MLLLLTMCGCRLFDTRETEAPPESAQPAPSASQRELAAKPDLSTAIAYLEAGKGKKAEKILAALAKEAPGSNVLTILLKQIEAPVEQLLPGPYRQVEVGAGESLWMIAARELGDPLMFYALARLNAIEVPAQVPAGTLLRVPRATEAAPTHAPTEVARAPAEISVSEIEAVAEYLARSGQNDQARAMLVGKLGEGGGDSIRKLLVKLTLDRAEELREQAEYASAVGVIGEALAVTEAPDRRSKLVAKREQIQSEMLRDTARRLRERGELAEAYETATRAAELDRASVDTITLAEDLRAELIDSLHNKALLSWRDRNVDLAIRTWESLLEVAPDFEPARVYLERARMLREKLDEP